MGNRFYFTHKVLNVGDIINLTSQHIKHKISKITISTKYIDH